MKHRRLWIVLGIVALLAAAGSVARSRAEDSRDRGFGGGSYVITNTDSGGNFFSRGVLTLHADHTISIIDSAQGGPTYYFSSQLGTWKQEADGAISARTIDFDYPPNTDVARLDFVLHVSRDGRQLTGTQTIWFYPLEGSNPQEGGGVLFGNFTLAGELIKP